MCWGLFLLLRNVQLSQNRVKKRILSPSNCLCTFVKEEPLELGVIFPANNFNNKAPNVLKLLYFFHISSSYYHKYFKLILLLLEITCNMYVCVCVLTDKRTRLKLSQVTSFNCLLHLSPSSNFMVSNFTEWVLWLIITCGLFEDERCW